MKMPAELVMLDGPAAVVCGGLSARLADWLRSPPHREFLLLIGVEQIVGLSHHLAGMSDGVARSIGILAICRPAGEAVAERLGEVVSEQHGIHSGVHTILDVKQGNSVGMG
jgi:hypothetical protein